MSTEASPQIVRQRAVVLGAGGAVGRLLGRQLTASGAVVTGLDLRAEPGDEAFADWRQCDATAPNDAARRALAAAETVFLCLPEPAALAALPHILELAGDTALIVDTLSVKSRLAAALKSLRSGQEYLSINPMFSPRLGFAGQNVAVVNVQAGPRAAALLAQLEGWGARPTTLTAVEHDRISALMQVATHAALLSLGLVFHQWGYDVTQGVALSTPPHRITLALLARISDAAPEVYWDIQQSNPFAGEVRRSLADALSYLSKVVQERDENSFRDSMGKVADLVRPLRGELLCIADNVGAASLMESRALP